MARRLGLLPQTSIAPDGITVADLVARGRYPHQGLLRQWTADDERAVAAAMAATRSADLADRLVDELSGGQRQRVWVAMALAQQTPILLLDEPTTFLDIAHQIELMELCADLHAELGRTLVAVLHDLNHASRYATHLIAMQDGEVVAQGDPAEIVTAELVEEVFGLRCLVIDDPETGTPLVVPSRAQWQAVADEAPPFPLHTGDAEVARIADITARMRASRCRGGVRRLRRRAARRDRHARLARRPAASSSSRAWAGASRTAPGGAALAQLHRPLARPARGESTWTCSSTATPAARRPGACARVGDKVGFAGPRVHWEGGNHADWSLLVADETGLPALLAIVESLRPVTARLRSPRCRTTPSARRSRPRRTWSLSGSSAAAGPGHEHRARRYRRRLELPKAR